MQAVSLLTNTNYQWANLLQGLVGVCSPRPPLPHGSCRHPPGRPSPPRLPPPSRLPPPCLVSENYL